MIGDRAHLGGGQEEYDMERNRFATNVKEDDDMSVAVNSVAPPTISRCQEKRNQ